MGRAALAAARKEDTRAAISAWGWRPKMSENVRFGQIVSTRSRWSPLSPVQAVLRDVLGHSGRNHLLDRQPLAHAAANLARADINQGRFDDMALQAAELR